MIIKMVSLRNYLKNSTKIDLRLRQEVTLQILFLSQKIDLRRDACINGVHQYGTASEELHHSIAYRFWFLFLELTKR